MPGTDDSFRQINGWEELAQGGPGKTGTLYEITCCEPNSNESQMSLLGFRVHARSSRCFYRRLHQHRDAAAAAEAVAAAAERSLSTKPAQGRLNKRPSPQTTKTRRPRKGATPQSADRLWSRNPPGVSATPMEAAAGWHRHLDRACPLQERSVSPVRPARPRLGKSEEQISALSPAPRHEAEIRSCVF